MNIVCFGGSNTYDPRFRPGGRYGADSRRVDIPAGRLDVRSAGAGDWDAALARDGVHFTKQGHRAFAAGLLEVLK